MQTGHEASAWAVGSHPRLNPDPSLILPLTRLFMAAPAAFVLAACSAPPAPTTTPAQGPPAYLRSATGCAVLAGGDVGSRFADPQVAAVWAKVNAAVTTELHDRLVQNQYRAVKLLVPTERKAKAEDLVFESVATHRCNRVLQVAHKVDEDAEGKYFRFDVSLFKAEPKEGAVAAGATTTVVATSEYRRSYRYPRTQAAFENFYTGTFAEQVLADLVAAGALAPLK